jgi:PTH1 family peptidyl-tRNA hydrolase
MSWLQQRPQTSDPTNYYTVGNNKNILIVGLGNTGQEYDLTRHNVGFYCIDEFVERAPEMQDWISKKDLKCQVSIGQMGENRIIAVKPATFMNLSGEAVLAVAQFYKINTEQILVIHDELDVDFGNIRLRIGGSDAGNNGIKSVSNAVGENYGRVRIGIGPKTPAQIKSEDFVLQKFSSEQIEKLPTLAKEIIALLNEYIYGGELPHDTRKFID